MAQSLIIAFGVAVGSLISYFLMRRGMKGLVKGLWSQQAKDFGEVFARVKVLLNDEGLGEDV